MPSPFPGMDPWLEDAAIWPDFHASFLPALRRHLRRVLPEGYQARLDERVYVDTHDGEQVFRPDVAVTHSERGQSASPAGGAEVDASVGSTLLLRTALLEERREVFLEVRDATSLVAVVELLSPANKRAGSEGRHLYLRKRNQVLQSPVHLVEIDLLRSGERVPMADPFPSSHYVLLVSRAKDRPVCAVTPFNVGSPLPRLHVPLRELHSPALVDLQGIFVEVYDEAGYADRIDYTHAPPGPPDAMISD